MLLTGYPFKKVEEEVEEYILEEEDSLEKGLPA